MRRFSGRRLRATRTRKATSPTGAGGGSALEDLLDAQLRSIGYTGYVRQAVLVPGRRFRHDFYFPEARLCVEVQGGLWLPKGAHTGGAQEKDYEKSALTLLQGIQTLFVSGRHVRQGTALAWIEALLRRSGATSEQRTLGGADCE